MDLSKFFEQCPGHEKLTAGQVCEYCGWEAPEKLDLEALRQAVMGQSVSLKWKIVIWVLAAIATFWLMQQCNSKPGLVGRNLYGCSTEDCEVND